MNPYLFALLFGIALIAAGALGWMIRDNRPLPPCPACVECLQTDLMP